MFEINGVVWTIVLVSPNHPELRMPDGKRAIGCCNSRTKTIYISEEALNSPLYREVLSHEIAHAAITSYGIDLPLDQEEFVVSFLAVYGDEIFNIVDRYT